MDDGVGEDAVSVRLLRELDEGAELALGRERFYTAEVLFSISQQ